jgi:hypothetical protein
MIECYFNTIIVSIIGGAGLLGGFTNYFLVREKEQTKEQRTILFWQSMFVSFSASVTVPLFLQILSNNILDTHDFKSILVFASFCVLAAFFSRRFLDDVYAKIAKKVEENVGKKLETKVEDIKQQGQAKLNNIERKVDDLEESVQTFDDKDEISQDNLVQTVIDSTKLDQTKIKKVLQAFASNEYTFRTLKGVASNVAESEDNVQKIFDFLENAGLLQLRVRRGQSYYKYLKYPIKIYSASFGIPGNMNDVTERIKWFVANNMMQGPVNSTNFGLEEIPTVMPKLLTIHCRIFGTERELKFAEGDQYDLQTDFPDALKSSRE